MQWIETPPREGLERVSCQGLWWRNLIGPLHLFPKLKLQQTPSPSLLMGFQSWAASTVLLAHSHSRLAVTAISNSRKRILKRNWFDLEFNLESCGMWGPERWSQSALEKWACPGDGSSYLTQPRGVQKEPSWWLEWFLVNYYTSMPAPLSMIVLI